MKVAVYGSLLSGLHNHGVMNRAEGVLVGEFQTKPEYTLVSLGSFPGLIAGGNTSVKVEVYEVEEDKVHVLDRLEGYHPDNDPNNNFYTREVIEIEGVEGGVSVYTLPKEYLDRRVVVENGDWRQYTDTK